MEKMTCLYISTVPASYRVDLRNELLERFDCRILHYSDDPMFRERFGVYFFQGLDRYLEEFHPDLVITSEFSPVTLQCLCRRKRYGFKLVAVCDDSMDMIQGHDFGIKHRLARHLVPRYLDSLILHSPEVCDWYRSRFGKGMVMPIMADERRTRPELERVLPLSERLRLGDKPIVAFVGRLVGLKNVPMLIRAFAPIRERGDLVIVGDGPDRKELEAMAPWAHFTGMLSGDELLAWYNLMDVMVLPSTQEAYGAVTGEALMAGAKVIVSQKAGSADLVREGENGYIVNPDDVVGLTDRIVRLLDTVESGRTLLLRDNLHPYHFKDSAEALIRAMEAL